MAPTCGSVRRATRSVWVNDSVSGSRARGSTPRAASCISARSAKWARRKPQVSCSTRAGVLLRSTRLAPLRCVFSSSNAVSISQRWAYSAASSSAGARAGSSRLVTTR